MEDAAEKQVPGERANGLQQLHCIGSAYHFFVFAQYEDIDKLQEYVSKSHEHEMRDNEMRIFHIADKA